ncbi:MAG: NfeD family protein [Gemmataceae bacterium]|nr:NfeD family protein [Gemmataceae bacterium]MDW8265131.1 NfeD family protein [Gemmataceae bacterium]
MDNLTIAIILIVAGLLLLLAEVVVPSGGILFVLAALALLGGVGLMFLYDPTLGITVLAVLVLAIPFVATFLLDFLMDLWSRSWLGRRFVQSGPKDDATVANMPVNLELEQLRGRIGRAVSALRPAGVAEFDGKRIDVITQGVMLPPGTWVRCIDVKAGKVIVRATERPTLNDLENLDLS